jgi:hypothetical protein
VLLARCVSTVRRELVAVTLQQRQHHRLLVSLLKVQYVSCLLSVAKVDDTGAELLIEFNGVEGGKLSCGGVRVFTRHNEQRTSSQRPCVQAPFQKLEFTVYLRKDSE